MANLKVEDDIDDNEQNDPTGENKNSSGMDSVKSDIMRVKSPDGTGSMVARLWKRARLNQKGGMSTPDFSEHATVQPLRDSLKTVINEPTNPEE